jgi:hypothetical protein
MYAAIFFQHFVIKVLSTPDDILIFQSLTNVPVINSSYRRSFMQPLILRTLLQQSRLFLYGIFRPFCTLHSFMH